MDIEMIMLNRKGGGDDTPDKVGLKEPLKGINI